MLPLTPFAARLSVALNQAAIRRAVRTAPRLPLAPRPPAGCGGSIAHYYHFLFDLLMPLSRLPHAGAPPTTYQLQHFGPLTGALREVFGDEIELLPEQRPAPVDGTMPLLGMNPRCVRWSRRDLEHFRRFVLGRLALGQVREPDTVVLIERMPPDPYFLRSGEHGGGGTSRRSLLNHRDVAEWLAGAVRAPFRFLNLRLEEMSLREQVEVFSRTALVVAQHGGGLANVVWMPPEQTVVELDDAVRVHFSRLSRTCRCRFLRYPLAASQASVDVPHFRDWLERRVTSRRFFR